MARTAPQLAFAALLSTAIALPVGAADIYRWTDEHGVVHFSDSAPADDGEVERLSIDEQNPADYDPTADPYSIRNQAQRTGETWSRLEERRQKRRQERRESAEQQVIAYQPYHSYFRPGYLPPGRPALRPVRPGPTIRRQLTALDELQLTGQRPYSINSTAHHERVSSSAQFLDVARRPAPTRPVPYSPSR